MRFQFPLCVCALVLALLAPAAWAAAPTGYMGTAPVNSQSDDERAEALKTALANVVVAQTGDSGVLARPDVAKAVAQAERYVLQYQYRRNPVAGDAGEAKMTLVAQFDSAAVDRMLQRLGLGSADSKAAVSETPSEATVWIGGIRNAEDYARVIGYLGKNNFVRGAQPMQAHGDGILVKLSLATDLARFLDAVGMERTLTVASAPTSGDKVDATLSLVP
ncbi:DUF2066 domain-containing protein [Dokdonella soli]